MDKAVLFLNLGLVACKNGEDGCPIHVRYCITPRLTPDVFVMIQKLCFVDQSDLQVTSVFKNMPRSFFNINCFENGSF